MRAARHFQALLFLAALVVGSLTPVRAADIDKFLPADTEVVLTINVRQLLDSPLMKKHALSSLQMLIKGNTELQNTLTALAFDPLKDLSTITAAAAGVTENDRGMLILRGQFDLTKVQAKAEEVAKSQGDVLKITMADGARIYEVKPPGQEQVIHVLLIDSNTLVASPKKELVLEAHGRAAGRVNTAIKKEVGDLLMKVDGTQSIWVALPGNVLARAALPGADDKSRKSLDKIETFHGGITLTGGVKIEFTITAKSPAAAGELVDDLNEGLNQARGILSVLASNQKGLQSVVDVLTSIKATPKDNVITIKGEVAEGLIDKALKGQ